MFPFSFSVEEHITLTETNGVHGSLNWLVGCVTGAEPVAVPPAVNLVADPGYVGRVRPAAAANVPHS